MIDVDKAIRARYTARYIAFMEQQYNPATYIIQLTKPTQFISSSQQICPTRAIFWYIKIIDYAISMPLAPTPEDTYQQQGVQGVDSSQ